jgi:hypothetical protein
MAYRLAPQAEAELDAIWYQWAKRSGNSKLADWQIDTITEGLFSSRGLSKYGYPRYGDLRPGFGGQ